VLVHRYIEPSKIVEATGQSISEGLRQCGSDYHNTIARTRDQSDKHFVGGDSERAGGVRLGIHHSTFCRSRGAMADCDAKAWQQLRVSGRWF
jgi:hypothetical protein